MDAFIYLATFLHSLLRQISTDSSLDTEFTLRAERMAPPVLTSSSKYVLCSSLVATWTTATTKMTVKTPRIPINRAPQPQWDTLSFIWDPSALRFLFEISRPICVIDSGALWYFSNFPDTPRWPSRSVVSTRQVINYVPVQQNLT